MESRAKILGHPVHPMVVHFPLAFLVSAAVFDIVHLSTRNPLWAEMAYWTIIVGLITALSAAVFGLIDLLAIPSGTRARRIGVFHGIGNVTIVALFAVSAWLRWELPTEPSSLARALSFAGAGLLFLTGWLGGELVTRLGVGVDGGANLNAPSSLSDAHTRSPDEDLATHSVR